MKIGRNDPCHCGSGKKYKKCHLPIEEREKQSINKVVEHFAKVEQDDLKLKRMGILINYVNPVIFKGRKVWALGNKLYANRDPHETFHDFLQFILQETLGFEWISQQRSLPADSQHFLVRCFNEFDRWKARVLQEYPQKNGIVSAPPNGWVKSMLTLAFDIGTLRHASNLPDSLLHRLKLPDLYQGARYEITVAAVIARLGFSIEWLDSEERVKHCEFIATHNATGTRIAVEAKSRHRGGVLHTPGVVDEHDVQRGDVQKLVNAALQKTECGKMPFFAFIDINSPYSGVTNWTDVPWIKDILKRARRDAPNTKENPSPVNATYFTNFSFHYQTDKEAAPGQVLEASNTLCVHDVPDRSLNNAILNALQHYGEIPDVGVLE